jgi:ferredoxin-NADP reductase
VRGKRGVRYRAGQYFYVTIRIGDHEALHHFTLSSSPTETEQHGFIEFTKRITASEFSQALDRMQPGAWASVRGPEGDFTLSPSRRELVFLSGGIGITPLRSMMRFIVDKKLDHDVVLIYGNNTLETTAFREELDAMAASYGGIRVHYVLSGPQFAPDWSGKRGFITGEIVKELVPDYQRRTLYISGPIKMVISLEEQLTGISVPRRQLKRDYFPGYD